MLRKNQKYKGQLSASHYSGCTSSRLKMAIDRMAGLLPDTFTEQPEYVWRGMDRETNSQLDKLYKDSQKWDR